jgi:hypothetical protein
MQQNQIVVQEETRYGFWSSIGQVFNAIGHLAASCLPVAQGINHAANGFKSVCAVGETAGKTFHHKYHLENDVTKLELEYQAQVAKSNKQLEKLGVL